MGNVIRSTKVFERRIWGLLFIMGKTRACDVRGDDQEHAAGDKDGEGGGQFVGACGHHLCRASTPSCARPALTNSRPTRATASGASHADKPFYKFSTDRSALGSVWFDVLAHVSVFVGTWMNQQGTTVASRSSRIQSRRAAYRYFENRRPPTKLQRRIMP